MQMKRNSITVTDTKKPIDPKALFGKSNIPDEVKEI